MIRPGDDSREAVAERLKRVRAALGYDQKTFGEMAGLLPQTYGPFETGRRDLTLVAAKALKKTHGVTLEFLFFGDAGGLPHRIASAL